MTVQEYENQINNYELKKRALISELDSLSDKIRSKCTPYIKEKIKSVVEFTVRDNPDITKSLSKEQLTSLKSKMNTAISETESKLTEAFSSKKFYENINIRYKIDLTDKSRNYFVDLLETIVSPINKIMLTYYKGCYGIRFSDLDHNILQDIKLYGQKCNQYLDIILDIEQCQENKEKQEAEDIWNNI